MYFNYWQRISRHSFDCAIKQLSDTISHREFSLLKELSMKDFLTFKRMITPLFIQIIFWALLAISVISSISAMFTHGFWRGLLFLILSPIFIRIGCEILIVFFRMHEDLVAIREQNITG